MSLTRGLCAKHSLGETSEGFDTEGIPLRTASNGLECVSKKGICVKSGLGEASKGFEITEGIRPASEGLKTQRIPASGGFATVWAALKPSR